MERNTKLSELDRKLGIVLVVCKRCDMEFHTLHRDDKYCAFCDMKGFVNPKKINKRERYD